MSSIDTLAKSRNNPGSTGSRPASPSRSGSSVTLTHDRIARRAYELWERAGRPEGQSEQHWRQAEEELRRT